MQGKFIFNYILKREEKKSQLAWPDSQLTKTLVIYNSNPSFWPSPHLPPSAEVWCAPQQGNLWAPWLLLTACGTSWGNGSLNETSWGQPPRLPELFPIRLLPLTGARISQSISVIRATPSTPGPPRLGYLCSGPPAGGTAAAVWGTNMDSTCFGKGQTPCCWGKYFKCYPQLAGTAGCQTLDWHSLISHSHPFTSRAS